MQSKGLLAILIMMTALTALSMDIYLPSMPDLALAFASDPATVQLTLSAFVFAFALGQLVYGPLADRFGRRPPLFAGLGLYLLANLVCGLAQSMDVLILGRALQGLGAGAGVVICNAIVRDRFNGALRTAAIARIAACVALAPITAPLIGAYLHTHLGWRASFFFLASFALILILLSWRKLPETFQPGMKVNLWHGYMSVQGHGVWRAWTLVNGFSFAALFAYIGTSSNLLVGELGMSPNQFSLLFSSNAVTFLVGSVIAGKMVARVGALVLSAWGCGQIIAGGLMMFALAGPGWQAAAVVVPMYLVTSGVAMSMPAGAAGALEPFKEAAGAASALQGFTRFALAAAAIALVGVLPLSGARALAVIIAGSGLIALAGVALLRGGQAMEPMLGEVEWSA